MSFTEIRPGNTAKPTEDSSIIECRLYSYAIIKRNMLSNCKHHIFLSLLRWETQSVQYLSCPAVSHICRLVFSPSTSILLIWKSTPESQKTDLHVWNQDTISVLLNLICFRRCSPSVVWMSPLNSLSVSLSRKLDFPAPASPAKTRRYIGAGSSVSSMSASNGFKKQQKQE